MAGVANVHAGYRIRYSLIGSLGGFFACRLANSIGDAAQYPAATSLTISYPVQVVLASVGLIGCSVGIALSQGAQVILQGVVYGTVTGAACSIKSGGRLWSTSARASYLIIGGASDVIVDATTYTYAAVDAASGRVLGAVSGACINMPTV